MDREKIDGWCEQGILGLVLGILVFGPLAFGGHALPQFLVLQGLTLGVLVLWIARLWVGAKPQLLFPPICWAVLVFMGYAVVRYFQADIEYVARWEVLRVLLYGFIFFAVLNNLHRQESTQIITLTLLFLAMAISFYACYQFFTKSPRVWNVVTPAYTGRGSGTFIYPNHLAGFLEMLMPLGWCYVLMGRLSHVTKIFLAYASVLMLAGIGVTLSRAGWVVTGLELVVLCGVMVLQRDFRVQGLVLLAVLLVAGAVTIPRVQVMQERFTQMERSGKTDDLRFAVWKAAVKMWRDNPWWGVGPAHFDYRFPKYRPMEVQLRPMRAHNDYLNTLVDWGVAGAFLVASAWVLLYWGIFKIWRTVRGGRDDFSRKKSTKFALLVGGAIGLFGILLHSFLDFNMHLPANAILAVTLMALLSSQWRYATERFWWRVDGAGKWIATLILVAGIGCLGAAEWRGAREYFQLRAAERVGRPPNHYSYARIEALQKAFALEPMNFETAHEIAECYRLKSWDGGDDFVPLARKAMEWYQRATKLDPYDPDNWLDIGKCLDWIGPAQGAEDSAPYYNHANELDPNGYFTTANTGWHYVQTGDLAAARTWFERSTGLEWLVSVNQIAYPYLPIVERRLKEAAQQHTNFVNRPIIGP